MTREYSYVEEDGLLSLSEISSIGILHEQREMELDNVIPKKIHVCNDNEHYHS